MRHFQILHVWTWDLPFYDSRILFIQAIVFVIVAVLLLAIIKKTQSTICHVL